MASNSSNKKKQDEKLVQSLRLQAQRPENKQCFDCSQRGPTYVNTTIGSFVCTKCSGILRGLTPPHRLKSISMATFTPEEVEFIKNRGNDYCKKVWLALYDDREQDLKSEQRLMDFMVSKYERKRYFKEPSTSNGPAREQTENRLGQTGEAEPWAWPDSTSQPTYSAGSAGAPVSVKSVSSTAWPAGSSNTFVSTPSWPQPSLSKPPPIPPIKAPTMSLTATTNMFTPDRPDTFKFPPVSDVFGAPTLAAPAAPAPQNFFANFDNNPAFDSPPAATLPVSTSFPSALRPQAEDKYAALKALDSMMKMQTDTAPVPVPAPTKINKNDWTGSSGMNSSNPFAELVSGSQPLAVTAAGAAVPPPSTSPFNPFRSPVDAFTLPSSQSMPFPPSWNTPSNLTVGRASANPFL